MASADPKSPYIGQWWTSDAPDRIAWGTLTVGERAELELHEKIEGRSMGANHDLGQVPIIHGLSEGMRLTLVDNVEIGYSTRGRGNITQGRRLLLAGTIFVGDAHLQAPDEFTFDRVSFRLTNLDQWANRHIYRISHAPQETLNVLDVPSLQADLPGGRAYLFKGSRYSYSPVTEVTFSSQEFVGLDLSERRSLDDIEYSYIRPFEQMLTLATGAQCEALDVRVGTHDGAIDMLETWPARAYEVKRRWAESSEGKPMIYQHMRFGLKSAGSVSGVEFTEIVPRWFALQEKLSAVCDLIFSLHKSEAGYLQQQMFTIASAIEGLHRRLYPNLDKKTPQARTRNREILDAVAAGCSDHRDWLASILSTAHRPSYASRVRQLLDRTDHRMREIVGDEDEWSRQLRKHRDGIGHVLSSSAEDDESMNEMVAIMLSARFLAELVLLREVGFSDAECRQAFDNRWEAINVRSHMLKSFPQWFSQHLDQPEGDLDN
ncbi:hypothetical protein Q0Z83_036040 [Actinoplanes sichuanensis]|uniref:HEPN domain-containing protein n=1 Tax=Actinoplanes sichuanensis TaxID=512349 RepID=A0ABW4A5K5_9ACTN|nr:HEPN domain-containing protein [Actinoplanes sichuanensis]BEL05413.1 hypothetical protein Q0Z83_036040 [Actinoplanes sichuanensis]